MADLHVDVRQHGEDVVIVKLTGDAGVGQLDPIEAQFNRIRALKPARVVLDLEGLTFIASIAMGAMVSLHTTLAKRGGELRLAAVPDPVLTALQRARLDSVFEIRPTPEAALAD
jgi:anti-anti-sigma factor